MRTLSFGHRLLGQPAEQAILAARYTDAVPPECAPALRRDDDAVDPPGGEQRVREALRAELLPAVLREEPPQGVREAREPHPRGRAVSVPIPIAHARGRPHVRTIADRVALRQAQATVTASHDCGDRD